MGEWAIIFGGKEGRPIESYHITTGKCEINDAIEGII